MFYKNRKPVVINIDDYFPTKYVNILIKLKYY